jgi:hypothetical protein
MYDISSLAARCSVGLPGDDLGRLALSAEGRLSLDGRFSTWAFPVGYLLYYLLGRFFGSLCRGGVWEAQLTKSAGVLWIWGDVPFSELVAL